MINVNDRKSHFRHGHREFRPKRTGALYGCALSTKNSSANYPYPSGLTQARFLARSTTTAIAIARNRPAMIIQSRWFRHTLGAPAVA